MTRARPHRAGPLFGVLLVVAGLVAALAPTVPSARALDPTPAPASEEPSAVPVEPTPSSEPVASPEPTATREPVTTPEPTDPPVTNPTPEPSPIEPPPSTSPDPDSVPDPDASPSPSPDPSATTEPTPVVSGPQVSHAWVNTMDATGTVIARGALDEPLTDAQRFTVYRIRFQVVNPGDTSVTLQPVLQVQDDGTWTSVPEVDPARGVPFYAASDDGRKYRQRDGGIDVTALRITTSDDPDAIAVDGRSSAGRNPAPPLRLPAHSFTELEFAVRATVDAEWRTAYAFRLLDGKDALATTRGATIRLGAKPAVKLTPGQRSGEDVAAALPLYALDMSGVDQPGNRTASAGSLVGLRSPLAAAGPFVSPHTNYTLDSDACAACHSTHRAQSQNLVGPPAPLATVCFSCHDGTGATSDVQADFTAPTVPANDPATSSWYSHPSLASSDHTSDRNDEFGAVLDRHAECADCHQPHLADATKPVATTGGWTAAGAIKGASGVSVVNGAAGTSPAYTLEKTSEFEYELCFKCHSGYTQLPAQDPDHPSRWALDKAVELNPANVSYHPVEAPGKNQTAAMGLSLAGTSPYKLWAFDTDSTIRCLNCHGNSELANPLSPPTADARLDNHAGPNRGQLIAPYRDRELLAAAELYDAADAALCLVCHGEAPMVDGSGDPRFDTNFNWHGFHQNNLMHKGTGGLDIDVDGAGQGNAVCAECHFRTHGTEYAVDGQAPAKGLVNFSPNIQPLNGELKFVPATSTTLGTCTLVCHGKPHDGYVYQAAP